MFIEILFKMLLSKGVYSFTLSTVYIYNLYYTLHFKNVINFNWQFTGQHNE